MTGVIPNRVRNPTKVILHRLSRRKLRAARNDAFSLYHLDGINIIFFDYLQECLIRGMIVIPNEVRNPYVVGYSDFSLAHSMRRSK